MQQINNELPWQCPHCYTFNRTYFEAKVPEERNIAWVEDAQLECDNCGRLTLGTIVLRKDEESKWSSSVIIESV